jgi:hypothetical protein
MGLDIRGDISGIGAVADLASSLINRFFPDKTEQEKAQLAAALQIIQGQLDANRAEASNVNVFVAGWRPFIGWVCGSACAWNWIGLKVALFGAAYFGHTLNLAPAELGEMMPVLMGMLGLGGLRTIEKIQGVTK